MPCSPTDSTNFFENGTHDSNAHRGRWVPANFQRPGGSNIKLPPRMDLSQLHVPIAYFIGGPTDVAYKVAESNFEEIQQLLFLENLPVGHTGPYHNHPDLRWSKGVIAWLNWQLI